MGGKKKSCDPKSSITGHRQESNTPGSHTRRGGAEDRGGEATSKTSSAVGVVLGVVKGISRES